jgi:hypothetical protein
MRKARSAVTAPRFFADRLEWLRDNELFLLLAKRKDAAHDMGRLTQSTKPFAGFLLSFVRNSQQKAA